jgi:hypothetical protein
MKFALLQPIDEITRSRFRVVAIDESPSRAELPHVYANYEAIPGNLPVAIGWQCTIDRAGAHFAPPTSEHI